MVSQLHVLAALAPGKGPFSRRFGESEIWPGRLPEEKSYSSGKNIKLISTQYCQQQWHYG
jgi:hypothetical protein